MKKIADALERCIFTIYAILWFGIVFLDLFYSSKDYACKKVFLFSNIQIMIMGCLMIALVWLLSRVMEKKEIRIELQRIKININTLTIILFAVQIYVFYNIYFQTNTWDPACIYWNAEMISRGDSNGLANGYFSMYPNNQGIVFLQSIMLRLNRIFGIMDSEGYFFMIVVQCFLTSWAGKLLYRSLRFLNCSRKYSIMGWMFYVILLGLSGWNAVTYTDMMGLIFPLAIFEVYLTLKDGKGIVIKWIEIIALVYWGSKIKPTVLIVFLAIIVNEAIRFLRTFDVQKSVKVFTKVLIAACISIFLFSNLFSYAIKSTGLIIDKEANMGVLHWMMMGLNPVNDGVFYQEDVDLSHEIEDKSERTEVQIDKIKERLQDYGIKGFVRHIGKKSLIDFNDGTFAWGVEGGFYDVIHPDKNAVVSPFLRSLYYNYGSRYSYLSTIEQFVWIMTLCGSIGIIIIKKRRESVAIVSALIGIVLFNLMFEARARYIILYVPFFIMSSMMFIQECETYIRSKYKNELPEEKGNKLMNE